MASGESMLGDLVKKGLGGEWEEQGKVGGEQEEAGVGKGARLDPEVLYHFGVLHREMDAIRQSFSELSESCEEEVRGRAAHPHTAPHQF
jgi:hypothetical protein